MKQPGAVKKIMNLWLYIKSKAAIALRMRSKHTQPGLQSAKLYRRITELPLYKFIECDIDGNYTALIVEGYPAPALIWETWLRIKGEYSDFIGDSEYVMYRNLFKEITGLNITLTLINHLVDVMENIYSVEVAERLNKLLGTSLVFDHTDPVKYKEVLKSCIMRSRSIKIKIDLLQMQRAGMEEKHGEGGAGSREYYQSILITLSDHAKYPITDRITVYEFCDRVRRFNKYCEQEKKRLNVR